MQTVRIHDTECSLAILMDALAPRSLQASWSIAAIPTAHPDFAWFEATGEGGEVLERQVKCTPKFQGPELAALAEKTLQVIWGSFTGTHSGAQVAAWVTIRAIDSTFYEVITSDRAVLKVLPAHFRRLEYTGSPWTASPVPPDAWAT